MGTRHLFNRTEIALNVNESDGDAKFDIVAYRAAADELRKSETAFNERFNTVFPNRVNAYRLVAPLVLDTKGSLRNICDEQTSQAADIASIRKLVKELYGASPVTIDELIDVVARHQNEVTRLQILMQEIEGTLGSDTEKTIGELIMGAIHKVVCVYISIIYLYSCVFKKRIQYAKTSSKM